MTYDQTKQVEEPGSKPTPTGNSSSKSVSPKGDPGSKPVIAPPGQSPLPKGYKFTNPTFGSAQRYATEYFEQQADVAAIMGQAADAAFTKFRTRTSEEYNRKGVTPAQLFTAALTIAPAGEAIIAALTALKTAEKLTQLAELVERIKATTERVNALNEAKEKGGVPLEANESQNDGKERGNFVMETADTLLDMALERVGQRWAKHKELDQLLDAVEFVDASIDLKKLITQALGPLPTIEQLRKAAKATEDEFEYLLYYQYYAESGKATMVEESGIEELRHDGPPDANGHMKSNEHIEDVPSPVLDRINELRKMDDFAKETVPHDVDLAARGAFADRVAHRLNVPQSDYQVQFTNNW